MRRARKNAAECTEKREFIKRCERNSLILPFLRRFYRKNCSGLLIINLYSSLCSLRLFCT